MTNHVQLWERFQAIHARQRLPHALLLIGPNPASIVDFSYKMAAMLFCSEEPALCGECKSCRLLAAKEHPDLCVVEPDKPGGMIKIDQIRDLNNLVFTSPQLANRRIVLINPAEKMNISSANALLKLLEEPPSCVTFFLISEQISTLPATIISRCQQWRFSFTAILNADYLTMAADYSNTSEKGLLFGQLPAFILDLTELMSNKLSFCSLAEKWSAHDLSHVVWLIYLLNSQMIDYQLNGCRCENNWTTSLYSLAQHFHPIDLFKQLDQLNEVTKKLQKNINLNARLVLENLLLGYTRCKDERQ